MEQFVTSSKIFVKNFKSILLEDNSDSQQRPIPIIETTPTGTLESTDPNILEETDVSKV